MNRTWKIAFVTVGVILISAVGVIALDPFETFRASYQAAQSNDQVMMTIQGDKTPRADYERFTAYFELLAALPGGEANAVPERTILKEYLIDKLQMIEAESLGLTVSLEEAQAFAAESRAVLEQTGGEALDFMMKVIEAHGITPDEYWNNQAVLAYQSMLTKERLIGHMLSTDNISGGESLAETSAYINQYNAILWEKYASSIQFHDIDQDLVEAAIRELKKG